MPPPDDKQIEPNSSISDVQVNENIERPDRPTAPNQSKLLTTEEKMYNINEASTDTDSVCSDDSPRDRQKTIDRLLRGFDDNIGKVCLVVARQCNDKYIDITVVEAKFTTSHNKDDSAEIKAYIDLRSVGQKPLQQFRTNRRPMSNTWFFQTYCFHIQQGIRKLLVFAYIKYDRLYLCVGQAELKLDDISKTYTDKTVWLKLKPAKVKNTR